VVYNCIGGTTMTEYCKREDCYKLSHTTDWCGKPAEPRTEYPHVYYSGNTGVEFTCEDYEAWVAKLIKDLRTEKENIKKELYWIIKMIDNVERTSVIRESSTYREACRVLVPRGLDF
jgi:hypothetical protein